VIHLDTHVLAWLYEGSIERFPASVQRLLDDNDLGISPMVELELEYLYEIGRLQATGRDVLQDLDGRIGVRKSSAPFARIIEEARELTWTRDPFDRIIVATAMADEVALITRDGDILTHYHRARWEDAGKAGKASGRRRPAKRKRRS
jgi:PIN domain nuclease of toxin-antitoxin system